MNDNMTALVPSAAMPVMDVSVALSRYRSMNSFIGQVLRENTDYGIVPGTGNKRTLLKPGAEKLSTFFGLAPTFEHVRVIEDWTGKDHDGEPFFYYLVKCRLTKHGQVIAEGDGSCNSRETKYRYRTSERVCPACGQATIIKGRDDYGGGWLCYAKKGGCGAKYKDGDKTIEEQKTGRIPNPDIADQVNTILKMAEKRALIAAVLIGVNASDYFTQDVEDLPGYGDIVAEYRVVEPTPVTATPATAEAPAKPNGHNGTPHHDAEGEFANLTSAQAERQPAPAKTNGDGKLKPAGLEVEFDAIPTAQQERAAASPVANADGYQPTCPVCDGLMWDNREGKRNPKAPDFKCKDKECNGAIWLPETPEKGRAAMFANVKAIYGDNTDEFKTWLQERYHVASSKELTLNQLAEVVARLKQQQPA